MKKMFRIIIISIHILFLISCNQNTIHYENDLYKIKLFGEVKSYDYSEFGIDSDSIKNINKRKLFRSNYRVSFDSKGNQVEHKVFKEDGNTIHSRRREYDKKGNLISTAVYDSLGTMNWRSELKYDNHSNLIERNNFNANRELYSKEIFKYNRNNDLVERVVIDRGDETYKELLIYDNEGNRIEQNFFNKNSEGVFYLEIQNLFKFDSAGNKTERVLLKMNEFKQALVISYLEKFDLDGNIIEHISYSEDGSEFRRTTHEYDADNNLVEKVRYFNGELKEKKKYLFDIVGNKIEENIFWNKKRVVLNKFEYDENGNLVNLQSQKIYGDLTRNNNRSYEFEYDENGSWVKRNEFQNGILISITERKVEYF